LEIVLLENIQKDIILDTLDINFNLNPHLFFLNEEKKLLNFLTSDREFSETARDYDAALAVPLIIVLHESIFANLQYNKIGILTNNKLLKDISHFYDSFNAAIKKVENDISTYETYDVKLPCFLKYCKLDPEALPMVIANCNNKDYYNPDVEKQAIILNKVAEAKRDEGFKILLNESIFLKKVTIDFYSDMLKRIIELNNEIEKELNILRE